MTNTLKNNIIDLYLGGKSSIKISKELNISKRSILRILKENNISIRSLGIYTDNIELNKRIVVAYNSGIPANKIAQVNNCSEQTVARILHKNNINTQKYMVNETFFDIIDAEAKAYFLGLLFADGTNYIKNNAYTVAIELKAKDKAVLEIFRDLVSPNMKLIYRKDKDSLKLRIFRQYMSEKLNTLGCTPRKSLTLQFPTCVPAYLLNHFIRGYFDGDGCLHKRKKYNTFCFSLASTIMFCNDVKNILTEQIQTGGGVYTNKNGITSQLMIVGNIQVYRIMSWLYKDATIFLKRKHDKFLELKTQIENKLISG